MKKLICVLVLNFISYNYCQCQNLTKNKEPNLDAYICLLKKINLPFIAFYASKNSTEFGEPTKIPKKFHQKFICSQNIPCQLSFCPQEFFFGFDAICQFNIKKSFHLVLMAIDTKEGCEQVWYLVTYTPAGNVIDYIPSFEIRSIKLSSKNDSQFITRTIESTTYSDSLIFQKTITTGVAGGKITNDKSRIKYTISPEGKFIKEYEKEVK